MEETDLGYRTGAERAFQQAIPNGCPAKFLPASQRQQIGLEALAGTQSISELARQFEVSRKFVYGQAACAEQALEDAFAPQPKDDDVLFYLPITKKWLCQLVLGLVLICHSSLRGVAELVRDLFDIPLSLGTVFNMVQSAVTPARRHNQAQALGRVRVGTHDEIFQKRQPVLVGVEPLSCYCYLLSREEHRDADTWGVRLLELQARGFDPDYVVADAGAALRAAQAEVMPGTPCRSDTFHALQEAPEVTTSLENQAYKALSRCGKLECQLARDQQRGKPTNRSRLKRLSDANKKQVQALALADDVALLGRWLREDILGLAGPTHAERLALYDFLVAERKARVPQCRQRLGKLVTYLEGQRNDLLAFAAQLDSAFADLAAKFALTPELVREWFAVQILTLDKARRWPREVRLRRLLGARYFPLSRELDQLRRHTVRASSLVENLNGRLRGYFFLRRHLGNGYLTLLQFFLNHRRFARSERRERCGRSPAELLTGQSHPHWLELLGDTRFSRN